jgi:hypothetical protein
MKWRTFGKGAALIGCVGLVIVSAPLLGGLLLGGMLVAGSERTVYARSLAPDGRLEARVEFTDCGALCGFARVVFVSRAWLPFDSKMLSCRPFWAEGDANVHLHWSAPKSLMIEHCFSAEDIRPSPENCSDLSVSIRPLDQKSCAGSSPS